MNFTLFKNLLYKAIQNSSYDLDYNDIRIITQSHTDRIIRDIIRAEESNKQKRAKDEIQKHNR